MTTRIDRRFAQLNLSGLGDKGLVSVAQYLGDVV